MFITITLNPVVDHTAVLPRFAPGALNRFDAFRRDPSGKGLNVARALHRLGMPVVALCLLGGEEGRYIHERVSAAGIAVRPVWLSARTRISVKICEEETAGLTELNERGPVVKAEELRAFRAALASTLKAGNTLVLSGSIPRGIEPAIYAECIAMARQAGAWTVLDADGEAMRLGLQARPDLIKPNAFEAGQVLGKTIQSETDATAAARELARYSEAVLLTMGAAGAILAVDRMVTRFFAPPVAAKSTVGCGDALLGALLAARARGLSWEEAGRYGVAAGSAAARIAGTGAPVPEEIEDLLPRVKVERLRD
ncbi:MAG: 1-phosphofructokinase family hexose kinase [Bacteroidota bacterium]